MEHKKGEKRVLAHSRTKNGQEIVKINSLSLGLTLSAFTSGCSATSCAMFFSLLHFEQFLKLCLQVYKSSLLQCLNNCSFCPVKFSFQIFFISRNSFGYYLPISFILMFMFSSKSFKHNKYVCMILVSLNTNSIISVISQYISIDLFFFQLWVKFFCIFAFLFVFD